jgi:hypothetical protein
VSLRGVVIGAGLVLLTAMHVTQRLDTSTVADRVHGRCVVLAGPGWAPSKCTENHAVPADPGAEAPPRPSLASCGVDGTAAILATIRTIESGGRYAIGPNAGGASGAYQFIDGTWNGYGGYRSAYLAPPGVQDAKALEHVQQWLAAGGVAAVPVGWYYPAALSNPSLMDVVPAPWAGNRSTPRQYQRLWLDTLARVKTPC